jgi:hypothetical protein
VVRPVGSWPDRAEAVAEFRRRRTLTIAFARQMDADLRTHFFPHISFGDLDCYQWLVVLGTHAMRHVKQIEAIKSDPSFPEA